VRLPGVRLRRAGPADAEALLALARAAFEVYRPAIGREPAPMTADYARAIAQDEVWVAEDGGAMLGMLVLRPGTEDLLLDTVAVLPVSQGQGIGRALLKLAERRAAELALSAVSLYTNEAMTENQRWYANLGYAEVRRALEDGYRRVYYRKPG